MTGRLGDFETRRNLFSKDGSQIFTFLVETRKEIKEKKLERSNTKKEKEEEERQEKDIQMQSILKA